MPGLTLAMLLGAYATAALERVPATPWIGVALAVAAGLALRRRLRAAAALLFGAGWMLLAAKAALDDRLEPALEGRRIEAVFEIESFAGGSADRLRFTATPVDDGGFATRPHADSRRRGESPARAGRPDRAAPPPAALPGRVRLSWYDTAHRPRPGELWRLTVRLRRPRGLANPGGFDYERWLFTRGIGATGYVDERGANERLRPAGAWSLAGVRGALVERLESRLPDDTAAAVLVALASGSRHRLAEADRQLFAATGTSHLMAISGLHIGLAAGLGFLLGSRLPVASERLAPRDRAALAALAFAGVYAALSGFAVPARRALTMLCCGLACTLFRRPFSLAHSLSAAAALVFLLHPPDVFGTGFQLSFLAVAALGLAARRAALRPPQGGARPRLRQAAALQIALWLALLPLTLIAFGRFAWVSVPANLVLVPLFGLAVVPLTLLGALALFVMPPAGGLALDAAHALIGLSLEGLAGLAALPGAHWYPAAPSGWTLAAGVAGAVLALAPAAVPARAAALPLLAALVLYQPPRPPPGCMVLDMLDVGQGLAVVVRTRRHTLLYDTGPAYRGGGDAGERAVVPTLRAFGVRRLDLLVLSHGDDDHAGGLGAVRAAIPTDRLVAGGGAGAMPAEAEVCRAGMRRVWDDVGLSVVHPPAGHDASGNDASCVLAVESGGVRWLLTGDIEAAAERALVAARAPLDAELATVPHHGSLTSSLRPFVARVSPRYALVSSGHRNRWGFPKPAVVERWRRRGAQVLTTAESGALRFRYCRGEGTVLLERYRDAHRHYWSATVSRRP